MVVMRRSAVAAYAPRDEAERLARDAAHAGDSYAFVTLSEMRQNTPGLVPVFEAGLEPDGTTDAKSQGGAERHLIGWSTTHHHHCCASAWMLSTTPRAVFEGSGNTPVPAAWMVFANTALSGMHRAGSLPSLGQHQCLDWEAAPVARPVFPRRFPPVPLVSPAAAGDTSAGLHWW
ncbi:hypothetical protein OHA09_36220 [Streptomyces longwoodensis]|uniref:hypothetical protein n=1 Tax=Streptomyces longwoodensis TaxID=68231 RepID=UPI002E81F9D9|nr:hypothetical protein [Streptomyces longwoodensis]WUC55719.1 hypothetical protein OHA09_00750 [Streptomyces longwoodensis]WUC62161.1 hypothetical protein OHA09_36220 [Streptomyces longwoodensis]